MLTVPSSAGCMRVRIFGQQHGQLVVRSLHGIGRGRLPAPEPDRHVVRMAAAGLQRHGRGRARLLWQAGRGWKRHPEPVEGSELVGG